MQAEIDLKLLKLLEENPSLSQRQLADRLGISLGKTNYCLKALKERGLLKWGNFSKNPHKLQYMHLLTPRGISQKLSLMIHFLERKQAEFERLKKEIMLLQAELGQQKLQLGNPKGYPISPLPWKNGNSENIEVVTVSCNGLGQSQELKGISRIAQPKSLGEQFSSG
jgi:EPS-associated MarR family transcriptional regulator